MPVPPEAAVVSSVNHVRPTIVPGQREPGSLTRFGVPPAGMPPIADGPSTLDAATIADRQREGGGGPSQRRRTG